GLDADDADRRPERLDGGRDAGDEAAAPDRHDHDVGVGRVLEDLEADRALARDDVRIVERMDEREAALAPQCLALLERLEDGAVEDDVGAVRAARLDLRARGVRRHHDRAGDALAARAVRERLRVVARGDGDEAAGTLLGGEAAQPVEDAADLERAGLLETLGLDGHAHARALGERTRAEQRRAVHAAGDGRAGLFDVLERDQHGAGSYNGELRGRKGDAAAAPGPWGWPRFGSVAWAWALRPGRRAGGGRSRRRADETSSGRLERPSPALRAASPDRSIAYILHGSASVTSGRSHP